MCASRKSRKSTPVVAMTTFNPPLVRPAVRVFRSWVVMATLPPHRGSEHEPTTNPGPHCGVNARGSAAGGSESSHQTEIRPTRASRQGPSVPLRRLVTVSKRGGRWSAEITAAGLHYLQHEAFPRKLSLIH